MRAAGLLEDIISAKEDELAQKKAEIPVRVLQDRVEARAPTRDFSHCLQAPGLKLIAEVKQASPSRGVLCRDFDPMRLARAYAAGGAAAISVLTEGSHFGGSPADLRAVRQAVTLPLLRKDFIIDPYQLYESRASGADAVLLIVAILWDNRLAEFMALSSSLGMCCLVEVHDERELDTALMAGAEVIGINNRDLRSFAVDPGTTRRLRPLVPPGRLVVAESGIHTRKDMDSLRDCGVDAVLVGESLVTAGDPEARLRELMT
ncbi:MAG: indole-3-glycerol phosphate synthase TrpC [Chloroflexota bacterium]